MKIEPFHPIEAEYIESGTFQGGEEDTSIAGIEHGEDCIVMSKKKYNELRALCATASETLAEVRTGEDFECVCHHVGGKIDEFFNGGETEEE